MTDSLDNIKKMIDAERAALAPEKVAALEETEAMKAMMAIPENTDSVEYEFGGLKIRHRRFLTKRLRLVMGQIQNRLKLSSDPITEQDNLVYQMLSEMCIDAPWNNSDAWKLVDLRTNDGRVYLIFFELMMKMGGDESTLKDFRRKSGRPVPS